MTNKKLFSGVMVVAAVLAVGVGLLWFSNSQKIDAPPMLENTIGTSFQGFLDANVGSYRFLGFEPADIAAFDEKYKNRSADLVELKFRNSTQGVDFLHTTRETDFDEILKSVSPSAEAVVLAYYDADEDLWQMTDNDYYIEEKNGVKVAKKIKHGELASVKIPAGKGVAYIHLKDTAVDKTLLRKVTEPSVQKFDICNGSAGWHLISFENNSDLNTRLNACGHRVISVWPMINSEKEKPFEVGYLFTNGQSTRFNQWAATDENSYRIAWVNLNANRPGGSEHQPPAEVDPNADKYFYDFEIRTTGNNLLWASWNVNEEKIAAELDEYTWEFWGNFTDASTDLNKYIKIHGWLQYVDERGGCIDKDMCIRSVINYANPQELNFKSFMLQIVDLPEDESKQREFIAHDFTFEATTPQEPTGDEDYVSDFAIVQNGQDVVARWNFDFERMLQDSRLVLNSTPQWGWLIRAETPTGYGKMGYTRIFDGCGFQMCAKIIFPNDLLPNNVDKYKLELVKGNNELTVFESHEYEFSYQQELIGFFNPGLVLLPQNPIIWLPSGVLSPLKIENLEFNNNGTGFKFEVAGGSADKPVNLNTLTVNGLDYKPTTNCTFENSKLKCENTGLTPRKGDEYNLVVNVAFGERNHNLTAPIYGIVHPEWRQAETPQVMKFEVFGFKGNDIFKVKNVRVGNTNIASDSKKDCVAGILDPLSYCFEVNPRSPSVNVQLRVTLEINGVDREFVLSVQKQ